MCNGKKAKRILAVERPDLAKEWHVEKNGDLTPNDVTIGIRKKVWWQCCKNPDHEWEASINGRNNGNGCPACSGRMVTPENCLGTLKPELAKQWHPTKNGDLTPNNVTVNGNKKAWWQCPQNPDHVWDAVISSRTKGSGCPACSGRVATPENCLGTLNPQLAKEWHPKKNGDLTPNKVTVSSNKRAWWQCSKNPDHEWNASINSRNSGAGCPACAGQMVASDNCLAVLNPELAKEWHPYKNGNLTPKDVTIGSGEKIWWRCSKNSDHEWESAINHRNRGRGCPACAGKMVTPQNSLATLNPKLAKEWHPTKNDNLTPNNVAVSSNKKAWWKCSKNPDHEWYAIIGNRKKGKGCPHCAKQYKTSFPEQFLYFYLKKIFNDTENGSRISGSFKEMDISFPSLKLAVEYDGEEFHKDVGRDKEKDRILHEQGWALIRIREKGCPSLKNSTSILYHRKNNKEETLSDALQFILQTIISRYPLNEIQLQQIKNLSVDLQKDRDAIKLLLAS